MVDVVEAPGVERGQDEVVEEVRHGLRSEHDPVAARGDPLAAHRADGRVRRFDAGLVGELVEPRAGGPARALRVHRLDHGGRRGGDQRRLVGLDLRQVGRADGDALLDDRDVAAQEEAQAAQALLAAGELGEAGGGRERGERRPSRPSSRPRRGPRRRAPAAAGRGRPGAPAAPGRGGGARRTRGRARRRRAPWPARAGRRPARDRTAPLRSRGGARPRPGTRPGARCRGTRTTWAPRRRWRGRGRRRRAGREAARWPRRRPRSRDVGRGREERERLPRGAGEVCRRRACGRHRGSAVPAGTRAAPVPAHQLPPVSRARLRMVGPPLPSRFVCMGWPLPQFGIG